jgi:hypothetical protein
MLYHELRFVKPAAAFYWLIFQPLAYFQTNAIALFVAAGLKAAGAEHYIVLFQ